MRRDLQGFVRGRTLAAIAATVSLLLAGCRTEPQTSAGALPLVGTEWVLAELRGEPVASGDALKAPTLKLDGAKKQASGTSGINRFAGPYELKGASLTFGMFIGTRMAGPPAAMIVEEAFLAAVQQVTGWTVSQNRLTLTADGKPILRFHNVPDSPSAGSNRP